MSSGKASASRTLPNTRSTVRLLPRQTRACGFSASRVSDDGTPSCSNTMRRSKPRRDAVVSSVRTWLSTLS